MTHASNVLVGYLLAAASTAAYVLWVIRRGRALGRDLGIGTAGAADRGADESPHRD
ncbi:MAG: hypothetical protein OXH86_08880 [Acidimicrobiaceae bacterium]|nr:hypothetical protein [Acidimicrobiaceae bacterium]MDE0497453.1 hypothetical protein [Acidimicrobiaceae bacterium]